jgi:hypothetical protein
MFFILCKLETLKKMSKMQKENFNTGFQNIEGIKPKNTMK